MTPSPPRHEPPPDVLAEWLAACEAAGRDIAPAEFCRDRPELVTELERRIRAVEHIEALMPKDDTGDRPSAGTVARVEVPAADRPADAPPGYEVLGELGRGGMGVVYRAKNLALGRVEAVKVTRAGEFAGPKALARFRFEAESAAGLDHPNIVTVYGVGEGPAGPYIAMRWVDGRGLDAHPSATPEATATLLAKVARAVQYAHERGILHRDLKPANILVDAAGEPFVSDFGIARRLDGDSTVTQAGTPIGTPAYMAPEQARGETNLTVAADVYSLGVVLFQLLTGRLPFGGTIPEVLRRVQTDAPPEPRRVNPTADPDLEAVCLKCLEKDRADRYRTAGDLAEDLERFARGEAVTARPPGFWDWVRQVAKTRPDPHPLYSWAGLVWAGVLILTMHLGVFALVVACRSAAEVWAYNLVCIAAAVGLTRVYLTRHFRSLPVSARHYVMVAFGHAVGHVVMFACLVPTSPAVSAADTLHLYPPLSVLSGFALFVIGFTYWSRFLLIGVGVLLVVPAVQTLWPVAAPAVHAVVFGGVFFSWAYLKKAKFGATR
jgi:eukaryotic-like serine/threonine-protein kinase